MSDAHTDKMARLSRDAQKAWTRRVQRLRDELASDDPRWVVLEQDSRNWLDDDPFDEAPDPATLIIRAADVRSRSVRWAWTGRLPFGYPVVQTGDEGLGKGVFAAWLMAQLTHGRLDGILHQQPVDVLVVAGEDGIEDTWRPRLDLAGADPQRVAFFNLDQAGEDWNIRDGIDLLTTAVDESKARIVFIDALLDHMPEPKSGESINSPTWVRGALGPLKRLARERDLVAIYSLHPPKARGSNFRDLVQASQAFTAVPRVGLLFAYHPDDNPDDHGCRRVLLRGKGNIGRNPGALEFQITEKPYEHDDGHLAGVPAVVNVRPSGITLRDLLPGRRTSSEREPTKKERAVEILQRELADGEWKLAQDILDVLAEDDLAGDTTVRDAKRTAKVKVRKQDNKVHGPWEWRIEALPVEHEDALTPSTPRARRLTTEDALDETNGNPNTHGKKSRRPPVEPQRGQDAETPKASSSREDTRTHDPATVALSNGHVPDAGIER